MKTIKNIKLPDGETYKIGGGLDGKITNCITEIPQDIKLELNDGVLTLKAGSKVYVPNGFEADGTTPKFDEVVIESDVVRDIKTGTENNPAFIFYKPSEQIIDIYDVDRAVSGSTNILATSPYHVWYDTNNNLCKIIKADLSSYALSSLPIALCTRTNGITTSINQTFNGFGYIGSTVFATKGVKGLIPNGRNEDGTLNNIEFTTDRVAIDTIDANWSSQDWFITNNGGITWYPLQHGQIVYNEETNTWVNNWQGGINFWFPIGKTYSTAGKITSFEPKQPFRAVDYNEFKPLQKSYITETYRNGNSWYRIWSDGWCEQGGAVGTGVTGGQNHQVTLLKPYNNNLYNATTVFSVMAGASVVRYNTYFILQTGLHNISYYTGDVVWSTAGYIT